MQDIQDPIAIIGIGCRFPSANNPSAFWQLLRAGKSAIREVPPERWRAEDLYDADPTSPGKTISRWGGFIDQVEGFDWRMFRIPPREAKHIDPQHRLLLEVAWEALEDAGLPLASVAGSRTSVTIGIVWNDYLRLQARRWSQLDGYSLVGNLSSFAANRLSYFFDLKGPSLALDAGCTSSLASLYLACQNLLAGEATLALAGGVNLMLSPESMIMTSKAGLLSPDGSCRALDASANGTVRGEGAGIVVLKRLSQVQPQDRVYALIRGIALGHNGHNEWIMGTSASAQVSLLSNTYEQAKVDPAEVDYVELHGSGFLRGDPVEARALDTVLGASERRERPCIVGSLKTNIGNLESASGIASVIKVALSLYHREIPPTLNLQTVNPAIPLEELHLTPQRVLSSWPEKKGVPLAAVNTLSFTGANGHAILAAAPGDARTDPPAELETDLAATHILPLSAASKQALAVHAANVRDFLLAQNALRCSWQDICYTASARRTHHPYRVAVMGSSTQEGAAALDDFVREREIFSLRIAPQEETAPGQEGALVFLFPHQSDQWLVMEDTFLWREPAFRETAEVCEQIFTTCTGGSLREEFLAHAAGSHPGRALMKPAAVFTLQAALADLWRSWGVEPEAVLGEGFGELAAAYTARMITLEDAMQLAVSCGEERQTREDRERKLKQLRVLPATLPFYSASAGLIGADVLAAYWGEHIWRKDLVVAAFDLLVADGHNVFIEFGAPSALSGAIFARLEHHGSAGRMVSFWNQGHETGTTFLYALGTLYTLGYTINWPALFQNANPRVVSLPTYPWQRQRLWPDWLDVQEVGTAPERWRVNHTGESSDATRTAHESSQFLSLLEQAAPEKREELLRAYITDQVVVILGGDPVSSPEPGQQFFALGMDSLTATQLINRLQSSLRQPLSAATVFEHPTIGSLAAYLARDIFPARQSAQVSADVHTARFLAEVEDLSEMEAEALLLDRIAALENLPL